MLEVETIAKYRQEIIENEKSIAQMKRRMPLAILTILISPFVVPFIPIRGKTMNDRSPYFVNVIMSFVIFSLMYIAIYFCTIEQKRKQIYRLNIWIKQIEKRE